MTAFIDQADAWLTATWPSPGFTNFLLLSILWILYSGFEVISRQLLALHRDVK